MPTDWDVVDEQNIAPDSTHVEIPAVAPGQPGRVQLAWENNNPGNIRYVGQKNARTGHGGFALYDRPEDGYQDLKDTIRRHAKTGDTLESYLNIYAPKSDGNDTERYVSDAAAALGVSRSTKLAAVDHERLAAFQAGKESSSHVSGSDPWKVVSEEPLDGAGAADPWKVVSEEAIAQGANRFAPSLFGRAVNPPVTQAPSAGQQVPGMVSPGNIDLTTRPQVKNADGSVSTVRSMSFEENGKEILVPTVSDDGRILSDDEAIANYHKTGKNLGVFESPAAATAYANQLHNDYAAGKVPGYAPAGPAAPHSAISPGTLPNLPTPPLPPGLAPLPDTAGAFDREKGVALRPSELKQADLASPEFHDLMRQAVWEGYAKDVPNSQEVLQNSTLALNRLVQGTLNPKTFVTMLGAEGAGAILKGIANAPGLSRLLGELPQVRQAVKIVADAAIPATFAGMGAKTAIENAPESVKAAVLTAVGAPGPAAEHTVSATEETPAQTAAKTVESLGGAGMAILGGIGARNAATAVEAEFAGGPKGGVRSPVTPEQAATRAAELINKGFRLAAVDWQKIAQSGLPEPMSIQVGGEPGSLAQIARVGRGGRPFYEITDAQGKSLFKGTGADAQTFLDRANKVGSGPDPLGVNKAEELLAKNPKASMKDLETSLETGPELSDNAARGLDLVNAFLEKNPKATAADLAEKFGMEPEHAEHVLKALQAEPSVEENALTAPKVESETTTAAPKVGDTIEKPTGKYTVTAIDAAGNITYNWALPLPPTMKKNEQKVITQTVPLEIFQKLTGAAPASAPATTTPEPGKEATTDQQPEKQSDAAPEEEKARDIMTRANNIYDDAVSHARELGKASTQIIQRKFSVSNAVAEKVLDWMEKDGIVGPADGSKPRAVLPTTQVETPSTQVEPEKPLEQTVDQKQESSNQVPESKTPQGSDVLEGSGPQTPAETGLETKAPEPETKPAVDETKTLESETKPAESETEKRSYGSSQFNMPAAIDKKIVGAGLGLIRTKDLAGDGRVKAGDAHVTLKYGLHDDEPAALQEALKGEGPITATIGKLSVFPAGETGDYDVVKLDVDSPELHRLNKKVADAVPHTDTHPGYTPHITVAYVKPGEGAKYAGKSLVGVTGQTVSLDTVQFSDTKENKTPIPLTGAGTEGQAEPIAKPSKKPTIEPGEPRPAKQPNAGTAQDREPLAPVSPADVQGAKGEGETAPSAGERGPTDNGGVRPVSESGDESGHGAGSDTGDVGVPASGERPPQPQREPAEPTVRGTDYRITDADEIGAGSQRQKAKDNLAAIRLLKQIETEGREATRAEQAVLVKYVGWGQIPQPFKLYGVPPEWSAFKTELEGLLTPEELAAASASTTNAHYTSPDVVKEMWRAAQRFGLLPEGGRLTMLEPSEGIGHFFGLMPEVSDAQRVGVELDSISGRIAKLLYPNVDTHVTGFEKVRLPNDYFDLAMSNVPFGDYPVFDPQYKRVPGVTKSIHDYFFAKALDKVRPGGVVAFITSHHTMDKQDPFMRKYFADRANLIGAIRLPDTAFKGNAGTEVTTDIIFLQKRALGTEPAGESWTDLAPYKGTQKSDYGHGPNIPVDMQINEYFVRHPEMMLGRMTLDGKMRAANTPTLSGEFDAQKLAEAIDKLPENIVDQWKAPEQSFESVSSVPEAGEVKDGGYTIKDGQLLVREGNQLRPTALAPDQVRRVRGMVGIRDAMYDVFRTQIAGESDEAIATAMKKLNAVYDKYTKSEGALHTVQNIKAFKADPDAPVLLALEDWDKETKKATKTEIFSKRVIDTTKPAISADSAKDALGLSLNELGRVDWVRMQELTGKTPAELQDELGPLIYQNPTGKAWEPADEYMSGNVRRKLAEAEAAARTDKAFQRNVEALTAVIPVDLVPGQIKARLGSSWIGKDDVRDFMADILDMPARSITLGRSETLGSWTVNVSQKDTVANNRTWGTTRFFGHELVDDSLNMRFPTAYDNSTDANGNKIRVINEKETLAARDKQKQIKDRFAAWVWEKPERAERLTKVYNEEHNSERLWQPDGSHLTFPGMALGLKLRPHQKNGVWRIVRGDGNVLLAHVVGAGKTLAIVAGAMELRRLGKSRKPLIVVPKNRVEGTAEEWLRAYPAANLLTVGGEDFPPDQREQMMARIATGNWDGVIVSYESFGKLPVSDETFNEFINAQIKELEDYIYEAKKDKADTRIVKELEKAKKRLEVRIRNKADREAKDRGITFEELGVDSMFVDEADSFKNLQFNTKMARISGIPNTESKRAFDMYVKTQYVARRNNGRGIIFATGTPVANSMAEVWTMQRYLQPKWLQEHGLQHFDTWANTFGEVNPAVEMNPDGSGIRISNKFNRFVNMPGLQRGFRQVADIQTAKMLNLPVPKLKGGKSRIVSAKASADQLAYLQLLAARAKAAKGKKPTKGADNILVIGTDGQKAAIDMRIIDPNYADHPGSKLNLAVKEIYKTWEETAGNKSTQLVFLDLSTPPAKKDSKRFSAYTEIRNKLTNLGVPESDIAFIQDYSDKDEREELFRNVSSGKVRVLLGSTTAMGVGVNVQKRLIQEHHLDAPYRPRDIEQRKGRMIRQGNTNPEVEDVRYVTEPSFDARKWDILRGKEAYINSFLEGDLSVFEMEDISDAELGYGEIAAIASGNPAIKEKVLVDAEVRTLEALKSQFESQNYAIHLDLRQIPESIANEKRSIATFDKEIAKRDKQPQEFKLGGKVYAGKDAAKEAAATLAPILEARHAEPGISFGGSEFNLGLSYRGFAVTGKDWTNPDKTRDKADLLVHGTKDTYGVRNFYGGKDFTAATARLLDDVADTVDKGLERKKEMAESNIVRLERKLADTKAIANQKFDKADKLQDALKRQAGLEKILKTKEPDPSAIGGGENGDEVEGDIIPAHAERSVAGITGKNQIQPLSSVRTPTVASAWKGTVSKTPGPIISDGRMAMLRSASNATKIVKLDAERAPGDIKDDVLKTVFDKATEESAPLTEVGWKARERGADVAIYVDDGGTLHTVDAGLDKFIRSLVSPNSVAISTSGPGKPVVYMTGDKAVAILMPLQGPWAGGVTQPTKAEVEKVTGKTFAGLQDENAGERGSAPILGDIAQSIAEGVRGNDYSTRGALESTLTRGLGQTKRASPAAHEALLRAASPEARVAAIFKSALPMIDRALQGSNINRDTLFAYYTDSRLQALRAFWQDKSDQAYDMDTDEMEKDFDGGGPDGSMSQDMVDLLRNLEGKEGIPENPVQVAAGYIDNKNWVDLRDYLGTLFQVAAHSVKSMMDPAVFDYIHDKAQNDPRVQEADRLYGENVEKPIQENHELNDGTITDLKGPANRYFPLIPTEPGKKSFWERHGFKKPRNNQNLMATGLARNGYTVDTERFRQALARQLSANGRAAVIQLSYDNGLMKRVPRDKSVDTSVYKFQGKEFPATTVMVSPPRPMLRNGKEFHKPAEQAYMPTWYYAEIKDILDKRGEGVSGGRFRKLATMLNEVALQGIADAAFHSANIVGALVANTPFVGDSVGGAVAATNILTKKVHALVALAMTDPTEPEAAEAFQRMADIGALPTRYATVTRDKKLAEATGARYVRFALSPWIYGPKGIDARARYLMYKTAMAINPDANAAELNEFINQLGNYTPALWSDLEKAVKALPFSPFFTAGSTMLRNGVNANFSSMPLITPAKSIEVTPGDGGRKAWVPQNKTRMRVAHAVMAGFIGTVGLWIFLHKKLTGKYPWQDKRSKLLAIPVGSGSGPIDKYRHSRLGNLMWGKGNDVGYLDLYAFNTLLRRGLSVMGLPAAYRAFMAGGNPGQVIEASIKEQLDTVAHPFIGPIPRAAFTFGTMGKEAYLTGFRDPSGKLAPQFLSAIPPKTKPGLPTLGRATLAALSELNAAGAALGDIAGVRGSGGKRDENAVKINTPFGFKLNTTAAANFVLNMSVAGTGLVSGPANPFAESEALHKQRTGTR